MSSVLSVVISVFGVAAPDGSVTTYGYDMLNRLNGLANTWAGSFGFGYDALSRRTSLTRPNGVNTSYGYDSLSHLLSVLHQAGANTLDGASYTYDSAGNRTAKTNYQNGVTSNYGYDLLYELTQVTQGGSTTETYGYDPVGNRLSSSGVPNYSYNSSNELTSNSNGSYGYDANGNTLSDPSGKQYTWDFENRLTQAVVPGTNGGTTTFKYDPFGRRIQKSGPLGTTNYLYDHQTPLVEASQSGSVTTSYAQGPEADEPLSEIVTGGIDYYERDGLGSVTSMTNPSGGLSENYSYDSFGNSKNSIGTVTNAFQYTSREFDQETGLYNYRARVYDPSTGRFLSEDPVGFGGGVNFYDYVMGDPVDFSDPSGKWKVHGNWCGPNWTGGMTEPYDPTHPALYKKPVDPVDEVCKHHDICYYRCRLNHPCNTDERRHCMRMCDLTLSHELNDSGLISGFWGYVVDVGIELGNVYPDAGSNGGPDGRTKCPSCSK